MVKTDDSFEQKSSTHHVDSTPWDPSLDIDVAEEKPVSGEADAHHEAQLTAAVFQDHQQNHDEAGEDDDDQAKDEDEDDKEGEEEDQEHDSNEAQAKPAGSQGEANDQEQPLPAASGEVANSDHESVGIWEPAPADVLSGPGARLSAGNHKFRQLCAERSAEFQQSVTYSAKRKIVSDLIKAAVAENGTRFLQRKDTKEPWMEQDMMHAIAKAFTILKAEEDDDDERIIQVTDLSEKDVGRPESEENDPENMVGAIWEPAEADVLNGRGASVNAHVGNKRFRALCFYRKPAFEAGNHAAKRRIATEIVEHAVQTFGTRFLKRRTEKGPWFEQDKEHAILKACQVMRDHRRPDRLIQREQTSSSAKKRYRATSTPVVDETIMPPPLPSHTVENPFGVHDHDILCGRGAYVNGHVGNQRLRELAMERKAQFDGGNYTDKRALATEIVTQIRSLDPPGRFLRRVETTTAKSKSTSNRSNRTPAVALAIPAFGNDPGWEELTDEQAIHKACQVMRDIDRPDRKERDERRRIKKLKKGDGVSVSIAVAEPDGEVKGPNTVESATKAGASAKNGHGSESAPATIPDKHHDQAVSTPSTAPVTTTDDVAAAEAVLDQTLDPLLGSGGEGGQHLAVDKNALVAQFDEEVVAVDQGIGDDDVDLRDYSVDV